jgi:uncharacterized protein YvpB
MRRRLVARAGAVTLALVVSVAAGRLQLEAIAAERERTGRVPLIRQAYRNNCETASLSMLLASVGVRVDQRTLQRQVRRSGPLDPIVSGDGSWIWGDPEKGFVGRPEGGGTAGGFGVYTGPIRTLAARYGVRLEDRSQQRTKLFADVARGRPVMAWIGLSRGPYRSWRSPGGKRISVNFGEHVVVLTGFLGSSLLVNDPLTGTRLTWTRGQFLAKWRLLGRRALGLR